MGKNEIKVYLNLIRGYHPAYSYLVNYPPKGVKYLYKKQAGYYSIPEKQRSAGLRASELLKKTLFYPFPSVRYIDCPKEAEVIHSTSNLMLLNNKPWVMDTEHIVVMLRFHYNWQNSGFYREVLARILGQNNCKAIMPWSEAARNSVVNFIKKPNLEKKIVRVYPAVPLNTHITKKPEEAFRFLFVGNRFYEKGGREVLYAFEIVRKKVDCTLTWVGNVPEEYKKKFSEGVTFLEPKFSGNEMAELMSRHHALVFPTYMDSFGLVVLEAMATGLPIIATRHFALPEMVKDGENGFLLDPPLGLYGKDCLHDYIKYPKFEMLGEQIKGGRFQGFEKKLADKMIAIASNGKDWERFHSNSILRVSEMFSIERRNEQLRNIYLDAIEK